MAGRLSLISCTVLLIALFLGGCLHAQRPVHFSGAAALPLDDVAAELVALGLEPVDRDDSSGVVRTRWEDLSFLYGEVDDQEATLFRRYLVVVRSTPGDSAVTFRMELKVCPVGTRADARNSLPPGCEALQGILEQHQQELERLGSDLRATLARRHQPAPASGGQPVVVVFDLQAPLGLLPKGAERSLSDLLATRLTETGRFRVVPRDKLRKRIKSQVKSGYGHAYGQEFQVELGRAMAANKLLSTQLIGAGDSCTLAATLYDMQSETAESAATVQSSCAQSQLPQALLQLARKLADKQRP